MKHEEFYSLTVGGPKKLAVSWEGEGRNMVIKVDDKILAIIPNRKDTIKGQLIILPDGRNLEVKLTPGFWNSSKLTLSVSLDSEIINPDGTINPPKNLGYKKEIELAEENSFIDWYFEVLKKYAVFEGRARRKEYWYFVLNNNIISIILLFIDVKISTSSKEGIGLTFIYALVVLIPSIAVTVRRLHDTCRSGWWIPFGLVPLIGQIAFLQIMVEDGTAGDNEYGADPKGVKAQ